MQFDPKFSFWLGVVVTAMIGISSGAVHLTHAIPDAWIPTATAWAAILAFLGSGLLTAMHGYSSSQPGPLVSAPPLPNKLPLIMLAIGLSALVGWSSPADAQNRQPPPRPTGNPVVDIGNAIRGEQQQSATARNESTEDLVAKLGKLALPDFEFALAMSKATNNVVSTPCWQAWVTLLTAQQKPLLGTDGQPLTEPEAHLATSVEKISELLGALRPDSTLSTGCAALAAAGGKDAATLITGILSGGALGLFKLPIPIGPIP
jgi:hypothetical protein